MNGTVDVTGVVLLAQPIGEFDKRLVILTRERGKITAFARGVKRLKSPYLAACNPFVFATFHLYEGRNAYTFASADVVEYFTDLSSMQPEVWYGFYFLELASYFGREGMESESMVNLIFLALRAIQRKHMEIHMIRRVFELRMMAENGEFRYPEEGRFQDEVYRTLVFCATAELPRLFLFRISEASEKVFIGEVQYQIKRVVDRPMKSLLMLDL